MGGIDFAYRKRTVEILLSFFNISSIKEPNGLNDIAGMGVSKGLLDLDKLIIFSEPIHRQVALTMVDNNCFYIPFYCLVANFLFLLVRGAIIPAAFRL